MVSRALAIVSTCMYDAWAAYDTKALGTQYGGTLRRPASEQTDTNRNKAISFAAYRAAVDLFPGDKTTQFDPLMATLGYDINDNSTDTTTPSGIGNVTCNTTLGIRHNDGSNQSGNLSASGIAYSDYTGFVASNPPSPMPVNWATITDPNSWQPLQYTDATGTFVTQGFLGAQWYLVTPFALTSGSQYRALLGTKGPATYGTPEYEAEAQQLIYMSGHLTDAQKMIAEYWKDGPKSETPPGHWCVLAQYVSARDNHTLAQDVKMFFAMTNAIFDGGIVAWDAKRAYNSIRPASSIPYLYHGKLIQAWGGPYKGSVTEDASLWIPYQPTTFPTPPFPEFISGHSTFSAAGATVLRLLTGSDNFGDSVTFLAGSSTVEPGAVPATDITLTWPTFSYASDEAGISRRYGGIHFSQADYAGRYIGKIVGQQAFAKASSYWNGTAMTAKTK